MAKKMLIDSTHPEETRVVVVNGNKVEEFDFDSSARSLITGNIYLAKVSRIEPSLQAAFVDYGGNRQGFLAFSEIHPDYYQIPQADREALMQEELERQREEAEEEEQEDEGEATEKPDRSRSKSRVSRRSSRSKTVAEKAEGDDVVSEEVGEVEDTDAAEDKPRNSRSRRQKKSVDVEFQEEAAEADSENGDLLDDNTENAEDIADLVAMDSDAEDATQEKAESEDLLADPREQEEEIVEEVETETDDVEEDIRPKSSSKQRKPRPHNRYKIQEVIKPRQVLLVQVVKEERGNKGAALTTYISLPGRYCVLMPNTARGGGISRKISNVNDRKRLRSLAKGFNVPQGAGLIIRTAGAKQEAGEIERDYAFLTRQWNQIRELTLSSTAPAPVYEESGPIKRAVRDLLTNDTDEILIEGENGYKEAREYMEVLMPERIKSVKLYKSKMPLFSRYQVENYLSSMFNPVVQLKSGGYLVIGVTEALVAIDVNSGRSTKEASIEDTALKTNLEAAEEVARQLKLRDLAGLIVIDFIDMEQFRHKQEVENKLKDCLRKDRARIQVGRISSFGLLEMSRQRLRTGLVEAITAPCPHCHGTGITRSDDTIALSVIRAIEEEISHGRANEINAIVSPAIANYLFNEKRDYLLNFLDQYGVLVRITADATLHSNDFQIEKIKNTSRPMPKAEPVSAESVMEKTPQDDENGNNGNSSNRRRRRRGGRGRKKDQNDNNESNENNNAQSAEGNKSSEETDGNVGKANRSRKSSKPKAEKKDDASQKSTQKADNEANVEAGSEEKPKKTTRRSKASEEQASSSQADDKAAEEKPKRKRRTKAEIEADKAQKEKEKAEKPKRTRAKKSETDTETAKEEKPKRASRKKAEPKDEAPVELAQESPEPTEKAEKPAKSKRSGWWNL